MKTSSPLAYLTKRRLANAVKSTLRSPTKVIGMLFILILTLCYAGLLVSGVFMMRYYSTMPSRRMPGQTVVEPEVITLSAAFAFATFCVLVFMPLLTAPRTWPLPAKMSDTDTLFGAPIPRSTLIRIGLLSVFGTSLRQSSLVIFSMAALTILPELTQVPGSVKWPLGSVLAGVASVVSLVSMQAAAVSIHLWLRPHADGTPNRLSKPFSVLIFLICVGLPLAILSVEVARMSVDGPITFAGLRLPGIEQLYWNPIIHTLLFPVTWAADLAVGALTGARPQYLWQFVGLLAFCGLCLKTAVLSRAHFFESAIERAVAVETIAQMRQGQAVSMLNVNRTYAETRKLPRWPKGALAIVWKDMIMLRRLPLINKLVGVLMGGGFVAYVLLNPRISSASGVLMGLLVADRLAMLELYRRPDLLRPMPVPGWHLLLVVSLRRLMLALPIVLLLVGRAVYQGSMAWTTALAVVPVALVTLLASQTLRMLPTLIFHKSATDLIQRPLLWIMDLLLLALIISPLAAIVYFAGSLQDSVFWFLVVVLPAAALLLVAALATGSHLYRRLDPTDET